MRRLALYDFDGTITTRDTLSEFFKYIQPNIIKRFHFKFIQTLPHIILYKLNFLSSDKLKKARIQAFFHGLNYDYVRNAGRKFSECVLPDLIKDSALKSIQAHLANGDDVFIVSASLDIILQWWCSSNDVGLITNVIDPKSITYIGEDCNGLEKVNKINNYIDLSKYDLIYAYGDTIGDIPMLQLAHKKFYQHFI